MSRIVNNPIFLGSSPQAWGTFYKTIDSMLKERFIPTGVGNIPAY